MKNRKGFTLVELLAVIIIIAILASVTVSIIRGRVETAKWSEGSSMAGCVRRAVRTVYAQYPGTVGSWSDQAISGVLSTLGFNASDLTGRYFTHTNFTIDSVDAAGNAVVSVSAPDGLSGSGLLNQNGWTYTP
jgi:prepilin-type N-terminal cleavage/methylation domain-containing protein